MFFPSILNKLTPEKFDKLCLELLNVGVESKLILKGVILLVSLSVSWGGGRKFTDISFLYLITALIVRWVLDMDMCLNNDNKNWTTLNDIRIQEVNLESSFALVYQVVWKQLLGSFHCESDLGGL